MYHLLEGILRIDIDPMYRRAMMMEHERIANDHFITRFGSLPVVNSAWTQACDIYQKTKERNGFLKATCSLAETGVQTVVTTTKPLVDRYQPQIEQVNSFACEKLALMEENFPVITRPTDEVLKEGQEKCGQILRPVTDRVNGVRERYNGLVNKGKETIEAAKGTVGTVKEYSMVAVGKSLETPMGRFALEKVNDALTLSEGYIEKYLPEVEEEGEDEEEHEVEPVEVDEVNTFTRVSSLSTKLRKRMYKRAMRDLKGLQMRSTEKLKNLNFTVDLIQYAKSSAADAKEQLEEKYEIAHRKLAETWTEINKEEDDDEDDLPTTFEGKTIVVARRLTRNVKQGVTTVTNYLPTRLQPSVVRERLENAKKYSEELYMSFKEAQGFDDLPSWLLAQTKEKMSYVQETISFLTDTFLIAPVNWLVPSGRVEPSPGAENPDHDEGDIEMEPLNRDRTEE